jgi:hypothetical protein
MGKSVWSREYVREVLKREDPMAAVYGIAEIWSSRRKRFELDPCFGLLPCEFNVHLFLNYQGEVGNGGHAQFFMNPVGAYAGETLVALTELDFKEMHGILGQAVTAFPESHVPKETKLRNEMIQSFPDAVFSLWEGLDREMDSISGAYWQPIVKYLQAHEPEILSKECD